jgi:hypothetical protein
VRDKHRRVNPLTGAHQARSAADRAEQERRVAQDRVYRLAASVGVYLAEPDAMPAEPHPDVVRAEVQALADSLAITLDLNGKEEQGPAA